MSKVVEVATKEIGVTESPKNSNKTKYGRWFLLDGQPWCAMFVSWCYAMAGDPLPAIGFKKGFAGCQTGYAYFKKNKWITTNPQPGDIVLFDWNGDGRYDHTGIFVKWIDDVHFETIEGNTSLTNQSNGGEVMRRVRANKNVLFARVVK
ncbi:MAG: CHAP domain-containing protein [Saprospiraceae bacterium]|nr:CHAP domain-containing protein [Saprospiraceae bacterium]